jgi:hypothetical protein
MKMSKQDTIIEENADLAEVSVFWGELIWLVSKLIIVFCYFSTTDVSQAIILAIVSLIIFGKVIFFVYTGAINSKEKLAQKRLLLFALMGIIMVGVNYMSWFITKDIFVAAVLGIVLLVISFVYWVTALIWSRENTLRKFIEESGVLIAAQLLFVILSIYGLKLVITEDKEAANQFIPFFSVSGLIYVFFNMFRGMSFYFGRTREVLGRASSQQD